MAINYIKFQRGSQAAYDLLVKKGRVDDDTLYFIYSSSDNDSGKIYLGTRLIGGADNNAALMFNAGPVLEIETDLSGNVTYSHKKIAAPTEEKESFNINKYLTGIKTDSYGHIISFNTANLDLNKYATNEEAKLNGGIRYINQSEIDKLNKLIIQDDDIVISSSVNAENVIGLNEWLTTNRDNVSGLVSNELENNVSKAISDLNILFSKVENTQTQISSIESELNKYLLASTFDETIEPIKSEVDELKAAMTWTPME